MNWKKAVTISCLVTGLFGGAPIGATENSLMAKKALLIKKYPGLFDNMEVSKKDGVPRVSLNLGELLKIVLSFSRTVEAESLNENIAEAAKLAIADRNSLGLTLGISKGTSHTLSSTGFTNGASSYLKVIESDSTVSYATLSKRNHLGMVFSSTLSQANSQSYLKDTTEKGGGVTKSEVDDPLVTNSLAVSVAIPVAQDWGAVNTVPDQKAALNLQRSRTYFKSVRLQLCTEISRVYWNLVGVSETIDALQGSVELSEKLVAENKARFQLGALDQIDWVRSKVTLSQNRQKLLESEIQRKNILNQIRTYLSLEDVYFEIVPKERPGLHQEMMDEGILKKLIEEKNPEVLMAHHAIQLNALESIEVENKDRLDVDLTLSYQANSYGESGDAQFSDLNEQGYNDYSLALTWNIPLFNNSQEKNILQNQLQKEQLGLSLKEVLSKTHIQLETILRNIEYNAEENRSAKENLTLSKLLLDKELEKFKLGQTTAYKLSEAQETYTQAQLNEILTRVRSEQNYMSLLQVTGDLLNKYGLKN